MSMKVLCPQYLDDVMHVAVNYGCLLKLAERLDFLSTHNTVCMLRCSLMPYSFEFNTVQANGKPGAGVLLYSGPLNKDGPPSTKHSWDIQPCQTI